MIKKRISRYPDFQHFTFDFKHPFRRNIAGSSADGTIFLTDPEGSLVHQYDMNGKLVRTWNGAGGDIDRYSVPTGITLAPDGSVWVVDMENNSVNKFVLPPLGE